MTGAKTLKRMRLAGARPPGFIVATEDRDIARNARSRELYPLIFDPASPEDWSVIHGLDVHVATKLSRAEVAPVCMAILNAEPATLHATYFGLEIEHDSIIPYASR